MPEPTLLEDALEGDKTWLLRRPAVDETTMNNKNECRVICLLLAVALSSLHSTTSAQVTFSKDWNGGKRAAGDMMRAHTLRAQSSADCHALLAAPDALCKLLTAEAHKMALCELVRFLQARRKRAVDLATHAVI